MASARLPGGVNRASMVRHALLALGPDEWLRTDVMARRLGCHAPAANEVLCRVRNWSAGAIESRKSDARCASGQRYAEWRIRPGMRAEVEAAETHARVRRTDRPYAGPPQKRAEGVWSGAARLALLLDGVSRWSVTPGLANTR